MANIIKANNDSLVPMIEKADSMEVHKKKDLLTSINESLEYTKQNAGIYLRGENKTTHHQIYEMNEFYIEMVDRLKKLKLDSLDEDDLNDDDSYGGDGDSLLSEVVDAINKKRNDPEIKRQIETILKLDMEIFENKKTLNMEKAERESYQNEICEELGKEENLDKFSEKLYELCKLNSETRFSTNEESSADSKDTLEGSNKKSTKSEDCKFIKRNIQLAKNSQEMGNLSLTDEEKLKLEHLLVDIDTIEDDGSPNSAENDEDSQDTGYHFDDDERSLLDALDEKLKDFGKCTESGESSETGQTDKFWKIEQRLRNIEEELLNYQMEKVKSLEAEKETVEVEEHLLKCPPEIEPCDDIKEVALKLLENYENQFGVEVTHIAEKSDFEDEFGTQETENRCFEEEYDDDELEIIKRVKEITTADD